MKGKNRFVRKYTPDQMCDASCHGKMLLKYLRNLMHVKPVRYVAVDIVTTGLFPMFGDRIIEIGAVAIEDRCITEEFYTLINIDDTIPKSVQQIHGITNKMLKGEPTSEEVRPRFREFVTDSIFISHRARFDFTCLVYQFGRLWPHSDGWSYLCTRDICMDLYPGLRNHELDTVAKFLIGKSAEGTKTQRPLHNARLLAEIWLKLEREARDSPKGRNLLIPMSDYGW